MIEAIKKIDTEWFLFLNGLHNSFFDTFFYYTTVTVFWIPLFAYLLYLSVEKYGVNTWKYLLIITLLILLSDQISVFIKNEIMRYRPSHNLELKSIVHLVNNKHGGLYSFVSSHATNTMALTVFSMLTLLRNDRTMYAIMALYVLIASYSRIYLGLHYPLDILCGWITGFVIAIILYSLVKNRINTFEKSKKSFLRK